MEVGNRDYKEQVCRATVLRTEHPTPRLSLPPLGQTGVGQKRTARRDADGQAGRGSVARPQVPRPQGESLLLAKDTRAPPDTLPSRRGAGLFPQSRDRAGHTPFRQEELGCQRGILRDWRAGVPLVVQRRGNHVSMRGTQVPLAVGPPSPHTAGKMPQDATESRHSQTFKNRRVGAAARSWSSEERGRQAGPLPISASRCSRRSRAFCRIGTTVLLDVPPGCRREKQGVLLR